MTKAIEYRDGVLRLIDQTKLPAVVETVELREWHDVPDAIQTMKVRGAPAIGITGAYGVALAALEYAKLPADQFIAELELAATAIVAARPTAVNLSWAVGEMVAQARRGIDAGEPPKSVAVALENRARAIHDDDVETCHRIGDAGAVLLPGGSTVLTHCNTGDFATGGYGTALGVIRSAWSAGRLRRVFVDETRPQLQGARLTVWELERDAIPFVLIADAMAGHFMRLGEITAVVVGADRVARNGDTANKIGTYTLAVLAKEHAVPFFVAAPRSSFDANLPDGGGIVIEERDRLEVTEIRGVPIAPAQAIVANPAFDVTPARLITAFITEFGVLTPPYGASIGEMFERQPVRTGSS